MALLPVKERLLTKWRALPANLRGALWMLMSAVIFVFADATIKYLARSLEPVEIVFFRNVFSLATLLPVALRAGGLTAFHTNYPGLQFSRALLGGLAMICIFYSLQLLPLADATAIMFSRTLWMIPCAVLFLHEAVRWRRWTATVVGFIGVLLIVRPDGGMGPGVIFALSNAVMAAAIFTIIKKLKSKGESNLTILLWHASVTILITAVPTYLYWQTPTLFEFGLLIGLGISLTLAHTCLIQALAVGEATAISPFEYSRVVFSTLIGVFFFAEIPTVWTIAGAALVILSGFYIARREARREKPLD
jgi:drug/metabolite transporter (DMT)-like permease